MFRLLSGGTLAILMLSSLSATEPIPSVTARATSFQVDKLFSPQNLCTDVGLTDAGQGDGSRKLTTNGYTGGGCMWHSGYIALGGDENPTVEFDLQKVYTVGQFHVWNHNSNPSRGFKLVSVLISRDGKSWQPIAQRFQFKVAPKSDDYLGERYDFQPAITARYIRFHCDATHRRGGNRELAGLGKVQFYEGTVQAAPPVAESDGPYPAAAGVVNVKRPPYSAKGDGQTDDTAAIQRAIDDYQGTGRIVFLPEGKYLVSRSLSYQPGRGHGDNNLMGAGADKTRLILKDATFTDPKKSEAVLTLGFNGQADGKGVHADWFNNNVGQLSIETGRGNPGAIGLQYYSNNAGALRNVKLISPDASGSIGLDLSYADQNGPCLIKNIQIDGFATGVRSGATVNSQTAEHITVKNCSRVGWQNSGQCLAIRGLRVESSGMGMDSQFGVVCLIDSQFTHTGAKTELPAIRSGETLFARNIKVKAYATAIENRRTKDKPTANALGEQIEEWVSSPPLSLFPIEKPRSLGLPIQETPELAWEPPAKWVNIRSFREMSDPDDSASLQRAIDSGASTIYLPAGGSFYFGQPVELRGQVRHIIGLFANVRGVKGPASWRVGPDAVKQLVIQDLIGDLRIEHRGTGSLIVKNGQGIGGELLGTGELFLENVVADWNFSGGRAWARQFNNERLGTHITNKGSQLWILGLKTERGGTLIDTTNGSTELLGGLSYTTNNGKLAPMFTSRNSRVSYVIGEVCYTGDPYRVIIQQVRGTESRSLDRGKAPLRASFLQGSELPLFVGEE